MSAWYIKCFRLDMKFVLLHEAKNDEGIRAFFMDVWELYVKVCTFYESIAPFLGKCISVSAGPVRPPCISLCGRDRAVCAWIGTGTTTLTRFVTDGDESISQER